MGVITANPSKPRRVTRGKIAAAVDLTVASGAINAGELIYKTTNKVASLNTPGASNANAAQCVGVAADTYPLTFTDGVTGPSIPSNDPNIPFIQFYEDGDHLFKTTAADTYNAYDAVYLGADGRTVQKTATGTSVGYVSPDQRQSGGLSGTQVALPITGAAGVMVYIRITPALAK
jgi:hypothetical protein